MYIPVSCYVYIKKGMLYIYLSCRNYYLNFEIDFLMINNLVIKQAIILGSNNIISIKYAYFIHQICSPRNFSACLARRAYK